MEPRDFSRTHYKPVGVCIFCGRTDSLTREHIVPTALGGTATLPRASCATCAAITGSVEQVVLRGPMWPVRVLRGLASRTKHREAPKALPLRARIRGVMTEVSVPIDRFPVLLSFPLFAEPGLFHPETYTGGITIEGAVAVSFGPKPEEVARELGASEIELTQTHQPAAFARMIAKIAFTHAFAIGALGRLNGRSPVIDAILGKTEDIGKWVGTVQESPPSRPGLLHSMQVIENAKANKLLALVRLFADSATPSYGVVLGELAPDKRR